MEPHSAYDFDIDIDLSPLLGAATGPTLVNAKWYELAKPREGRATAVQAKLDQTFRNAVLYAQWQASARRTLDRRRALRVPVLSRVHVEGGAHLVACDISMSGLRCSGEPTAPIMDVEFKLPSAPFPIDARVEVVSYKESKVIPLVGLRFAWIDRPYVEHIARYVAGRRERVLRAA